MHMQDLIGGIEAILFASANPMTEADVRKVVVRWVASLPPDAAQADDPSQVAVALGSADADAPEGAAAAEPTDGVVSQAAGAHDQTPEPEAQADGAIEAPVQINAEGLIATDAEADKAAAQTPDAPDVASAEAEATNDGRAGRITVQAPLASSASAESVGDTEHIPDSLAISHASDRQNVESIQDIDDTADAESFEGEATAASDTAASDTAADAASVDDATTDAQPGDVVHSEPELFATASEAPAAQPDASPLPKASAAADGFDWRKNFKAAIAAVKMRWQDPHEYCGFTLVEVADALAFRSNSRFAPVLLAMRDEKPPRLSRPAMETLAIIAYRQPVTKPESDHIRGVDCGGTIKMLLDRQLIRIVGKKEEPGRPLLYGTGPEFLSFFNLASVHNLPSLRAFDELNDDSEDALRELDGLPSLQELSAQAKQFRLNDEPAMGSLDAAVEALRRTESTSRDALAAQGIDLATDDDDKPLPQATQAPTQH